MPTIDQLDSPGRVGGGVRIYDVPTSNLTVNADRSYGAVGGDSAYVEGFDWSHIGLLNAAPGGRKYACCLISESLAVCAAHINPNPSGPATFIATDGAAITRNLSVLWEDAATDILLYELDTPIDPGADLVNPVKAGDNAAGVFSQVGHALWAVNGLHRVLLVRLSETSSGVFVNWRASFQGETLITGDSGHGLYLVDAAGDFLLLGTHYQNGNASCLAASKPALDGYAAGLAGGAETIDWKALPTTPIYPVVAAGAALGANFRTQTQTAGALRRA